MALVVMAFPTNKFQPKTVWEHYCKYTLHIHPSQATEDQYDYFLDCWSGDDEYQYLYDYYENKYPEYNQILITTQTQVQPSISTYVPKTN